MKQLHPIQLQILRKLLFADKLRYSRLKPDPEMENNQFNFHLDQLIKGTYVLKQDKHYLLTDFGKEYVGRLDNKQSLIARQPKVVVSICCTKKNGEATQYLIHTRSKQPFYGCQEFPRGKVNFGESIVRAAKRELKEEANLEGKPVLVAQTHYLVFDKNTKDLIDDLFIFRFLVKNPTGKLLANQEGTLNWVHEKNLESFVTNHIESLPLFKKQIQRIKNFTGKIVFEEIHHESEKF